MPLPCTKLLRMALQMLALTLAMVVCGPFRWLYGWSEAQATKLDAERDKTMAQYIEDTQGYKDKVGGYHDGGVGWNPQGHFCGECARACCQGCINQDAGSA